MSRRISFSPDITRRYQELRDAAIYRGEQKRLSAYAKHERLRVADFAVKEAGAKQLAASLRGGDEARLAAIHLRDAISKRQDILNELGYDQRFDDADYHCKICEDTGVFEEARCVCYKEVAYPFLFEASNMQDLAQQRFEHFDLSIFSEQAEVIRSAKKEISLPSSRNLHQRLREAAELYCETFTAEGADNYFYYGRTGTGKTFLAACIGNRLLEAGQQVYFLSFTEMMQKLSQYRILTNSFNPDPLKLDRAEQFYKGLYEADLLIIDDLGSAPGDSGTHASEMIQLLDSRFAQQKAVIITSNLDLEQIQKRYDERLLSRLLGSMKAVRFYGTDVRVKRER